MKGAGQRPFGIFPKIHPIWWGTLPLSWFGTTSSYYSNTVISNVSKTLLEIFLDMRHENKNEDDDAGGYLASGA